MTSCILWLYEQQVVEEARQICGGHRQYGNRGRANLNTIGHRNNIVFNNLCATSRAIVLT